MITKSSHSNVDRFGSRRSHIFFAPSRLLRQGFTIVELLIVVVVIAILAAITVVSFNGIAKSAAESSMKSDLHNGSTLLEMHRVSNGSYPSSTAALNSGAGLKVSGGNEITYTGGGNSYCLSVASEKVGTVFSVKNGGAGIVSGDCSGNPGGGTGPISTDPIIVKEGSGLAVQYSVSPSYTGIYNYCIRGVMTSGDGGTHAWEVAVNVNAEPFINLTDLTYLSAGNSNYRFKPGVTTPDADGYFYIEWAGTNPQQYQYVSPSNPITIDVCMNNAYHLFALRTFTAVPGSISGGGWNASQAFSLTSSHIFWNRYQFDVDVSTLLNAANNIPQGQKRIRVSNSHATISHVSGTVYRVTSASGSDNNSYINQETSRSVQLDVGNFGDGVLVP